MAEPETGLTGRAFRIRWTLASAAGMALAAAAARPLSYVVGEAVGGVLGEVPAEAAIGAVAGGGVLGGIALAQWFLLRGRVAWAGRWPVAGALAGANAAAAGFVVVKALTLAGYETLGAGDGRRRRPRCLSGCVLARLPGARSGGPLAGSRLRRGISSGRDRDGYGGRGHRVRGGEPALRGAVRCGVRGGDRVCDRPAGSGCSVIPS